jgi:uncharacterized membrane protein
MQQQCVIKGKSYSESEGMVYGQLRPSVQEFLKTLKGDWKPDSFISYNALNDLLRAYIANVTSEEIKEHQLLAKKIQDRFQFDETLRPINPDLEVRPPSFGERVSDKIADFGGSWTFIIIFFVILIGWMIINAVMLGTKAFDPYPFILLNLVLSCIAAVQAPVIMMSQNRQETKDRARGEYDFKVNMKAETEVRLLHEKIDHLLLHQHQNMVELFQLQLDVMQQLQQRWDAMDKKAAETIAMQYKNGGSHEL